MANGKGVVAVQYCHGGIWVYADASLVAPSLRMEYPGATITQTSDHPDNSPTLDCWGWIVVEPDGTRHEFDGWLCPLITEPCPLEPMGAGLEYEIDPDYNEDDPETWVK